MFMYTMSKNVSLFVFKNLLISIIFGVPYLEEICLCIRECFMLSFGVINDSTNNNRLSL